VCSCFKVHEKDINDAIEQGADSVNTLGEQLKCGTNCGSCKSELQQMLDAACVSTAGNKARQNVEVLDEDSTHLIPVRNVSPVRRVS
jgi:NAD(P)H-nitrite reductase large subunit